MSSMIRIVLRPVYFAYIGLVGLAVFVPSRNPRRLLASLVAWAKYLPKSWQDSKVN